MRSRARIAADGDRRRGKGRISSIWLPRVEFGGYILENVFTPKSDPPRRLLHIRHIVLDAIHHLLSSWLVAIMLQLPLSSGVPLPELFLSPWLYGIEWEDEDGCGGSNRLVRRAGMGGASLPLISHHGSHCISEPAGGPPTKNRVRVATSAL